MPRKADGSGNEAFLPLPPTPWGKRECKPLTASPMAYGHRCKQGRTGLGRPLKTICPAPSVPKLTEKQGPNLPGAGSRDISWMLPSKPAVPGTARRERGP